jgi:hypothetical protein
MNGALLTLYVFIGAQRQIIMSTLQVLASKYVHWIYLALDSV